MGYLAEGAQAREHPRHVLPKVRSLLMLAVDTRTSPPAARAAGAGGCGRYAWGEDYRQVSARVWALADFHRRLTPAAAVRGVVDTAPLLEREFAQLAGLGWIGKNTMLVNSQLGSWLVLAALLTSETLAYDAGGDEPLRDVPPLSRCLSDRGPGGTVSTQRAEVPKELS